MGAVRVQVASDWVPALVAHWRPAFNVPAEVPDADVLADWYDDAAISLEAHCRRHKGQMSRAQVEGRWAFVESERGAAHVPRRWLGYQMLLQAWDTSFPWEPDDVVRLVPTAPHWLNRVVVVVWSPVGHGKERMGAR